MQLRRRTKIVVTVGPAIESPAMMEKVIKAGADVFRCNFSHDTHENHAKRIQMIRDLSKKAGREVTIFADLQGPKIRVSRFKNKKVILTPGAEFVLDAKLGVDEGDEKQVGIDYKPLPKEVFPGDVLLLDDGKVVLTVKKIEGSRIYCTVTVGGPLSNNKGLNRKGGGLTAKALTQKDKDDIKFASKCDIDYFAISFPRNAADMEEARRLVRAAGSQAGVIAKVERAEAIHVLDEIIEASDAVMVARGDLGVEIGDENLPTVQKRMIRRAIALNKPVITATQMMDSMIHNTIPTRAEVFDIANAVLDSTDAVMLSAETAQGDYPALVVETMSRICVGAERSPEIRISDLPSDAQFKSIGEAITSSAMYIANHLDIKAIICLTETGLAALMLSRTCSGVPIYAFTRHKAVERRMNLYRNVYPMSFDITKIGSKASISESVAEELRKKKLLKNGDCVIITRGDLLGKRGKTNQLKVFQVGSSVEKESEQKDRLLK